MDLNAAKYPADALYYTDIKSYEQGAGQHISKETNRLPALSCLPINSNWFWKESFPVTPVKKAEEIVNDNIIPFNRVYCNFILNVAPNRDGLVDDNAVDALRKTGDLWKNTEPYAQLPPNDGLIISSDIIKHKPSDSSWSHDMNIMDFANDDDFTTAWRSNPVVEKSWIEFELDREQPFNMVTIHEGRRNGAVRKYRIDYMENNVWKTLLTGENEKKTKIERFPAVWGNKIRITFEQFDAPPAIAEIGVYNEKR
jgi:alpha-L-fucosidase